MSDTLKPTKISREGVILIKSFEGFRPRAIQRADGRWTIGYGHTASAREGLTVSEPDAELLLQYDLIPVAKAVEAVETPLNQHQYDALASFAFSVGVDRFRTSDVLARLNAGAPGEAADALIAWNDDAGMDMTPRRRAAERALFVARADAPVSLADLLAAPLPPPAVTLVTTTAETEAAAESSAFQAIDVAPFPEATEIAPMTREAAVAALLGETHAPVVEEEDDAPAAESAPEAAASEPTDAPEAVSEPAPSPVAEADPVEPQVETAAESVAAEIEPSAPEPVAPPRPTWAAPNPAAFYSPYALRAVGPLQTVLTPQPVIAPAVENLVPADASEPAPVIAPEPEVVPANDVEATLDTASSAIATDETPPEPQAEPEAPADALAPEPLMETVASVEVEPLQYQPPVAFADQPVQVPVFATAPVQPEAPTLVLTEAPGLLETAADHRLPWPDTGFSHIDQTPLFEAEGDASQETVLQPLQDPEAPRRFDWSETATFLIMGGIGLVSFGAAMAAFRRAAESNGSDTALIGWVLALIALACVSVSGYNLYQRWGRADRA